MTKRISRREMLGGTVAAAAMAGLGGSLNAAPAAKAILVPNILPARIAPAVVTSPNGFPLGVEKALKLMSEGADTLDAAVEAVKIQEDDPNDDSVGYGGLPNEDGIVSLDASCMHGPTMNAGSVAALEDIRHAASVARDVLWYTDHVMLVGEGAKRFALKRGYKAENLLTEASRQKWLEWKSQLSKEDDWLEPGEKLPEGMSAPESVKKNVLKRQTGTIHFSACNEKGEVSGVTTTSGLSWKIPGRVGDSPIVGAGMYTDGRVGSAGSTGRGEAVITVCGAHTVVEFMRNGLHPKDACLAAIKRLLEVNRTKYLWKEGKPTFQVRFYAVDVKGRVGGAGIFPGKYACADEKGPRLEDCAFLFEGEPK